jgi:hypothetical protein
VRWRGYVSLPPHRSTEDHGAGLNGVDTQGGPGGTGGCSHGQIPRRRLISLPVVTQ